MSAAFVPTNRYSKWTLRPYWFIGALSKELGKKPKSIVLWGEKIVLFRDAQGIAHALLDRCSHRNVPLSKGKCVGNNLECPYHGWQFNAKGQCVEIPALVGEVQHPKRNVPAFPVVEQQGYIWVYTDHQSTPNHQPFEFPHFEDSDYTMVHFQAEFEGSIHANAENILDVPHTAFLHKGLFRGVERNQIDTVIRRYADFAECQYLGEPRPEGLLGRILAPDGGEVEHFDRFILPSIAQVEYRLGHRNIVISNFLSPISDQRVKMYTMVAVKFRFFASLLRPIVLPFALKVVKQDQDMLALQTKSIADFQGEEFNYTDVDVLGPSIMRLLKRASQEAIAIVGKPNGEPDTILKGKLKA